MARLGQEESGQYRKWSNTAITWSYWRAALQASGMDIVVLCHLTAVTRKEALSLTCCST